MKIKSVHNETFIFDSSKMLKVKNKHFKTFIYELLYNVCECINEIILFRVVAVSICQNIFFQEILAMLSMDCKSEVVKYR